MVRDLLQQGDWLARVTSRIHTFQCQSTQRPLQPDEVYIEGAGLQIHLPTFWPEFSPSSFHKNYETSSGRASFKREVFSVSST